MTLLHASYYQDHLYDIDPRVTYLPLSTCQPFSFGVTAQNVIGTTQLHIAGSLIADDAHGISEQVISVTYLNDTLIIGNVAAPPFLVTTVARRKILGSLAGQAVTEIEPNFPGLSSLVQDGVTTPVIFTDGLSQPILLEGTNLYVQISQTVINGDNWYISGAARPGSDISTIVGKLRVLYGAPMAELFGNPLVEPFTTYSNLWFNADQLPDQLTGVLLALARRTWNVSQGL